MVNLAKLKNGGVWIPAKETGSDWLLIGLHGSGGSGRNFEGLDTVLNISGMNYLFPNGPIPSYSSYMWYNDTHSRHDAYPLLASILKLCDTEGFSADHTFLLGFSQGAALTFEFGARHKDLLAGYIAISGRIEGLSSLLNQANRDIVRNGEWLVTHGREDYNLSIDVMSEQVSQLRKHGFNIEFQQYHKIHEMDANEELPAVRQWITSRMR